MSLAIQMIATGGPDVLQARRGDLPAPGAGEVRLRHEAIGVNFVDIYHRTGLYPVPTLPAVPGVEGAGIVEAVGPDVAGIAPGDRMAYAGLPIGAYAEARNIPAGRLVPLPPSVPSTIAAGALLRGVTAHMLLHQVYPVGPGTRVLVHAAAGGLGQILTRWAKALGALVIGTVGSEAKAEIARACGADHAILYRSEDFVAATRRLTDGLGVDIACDGIGGDILPRTFDAVARFGTVASIGQAAGPCRAIEIAELGPARSLALARPSVFAYAAEPETYRGAADSFLARVAAGMPVTIGAEYPLTEAAAAHRALEAGTTTGSILLRP